MPLCLFLIRFSLFLLFASIPCLYTVLQKLGPGQDCDGPGPIKPPHCHHHPPSSSSSGSDSDGDNDSSGSSTTRSSGSYSNQNVSVQSSNTASSYNQNPNAQVATGGNMNNPTNYWLLATAASAMAAMFAVQMGQKKNVMGMARQGTDTTGAVAQRNTVVSGLADGALPTTNEPPPVDTNSGIEMRPGYNMETGPNGVELHPGYEMA